MSTYTRAEQKRSQNQYVYYSFYQMDSRLPNAWSPEYPWCKYWITAKSGISRRDLFNAAIEQHDIYKSNNFAQIEAALKTIPGVDASTIERFKALTTINVRGDMNCKLALYGGAHINFDLLLKHIKACKNKTDVTTILGELSTQVYTAALNGAFTKLYNVANSISINPASDPSEVDQTIEKQITDLYNSLVFGTKRYPALEFPEGPTGFDLPQRIYQLALENENEKNWTPAKILKDLIAKEAKIINTTEKSLGGRTT